MSLQGSPRGHAVISTEDSAPHIRVWDPQIDFTYNGNGDILTVTKTASDGTIVKSTWVYTGTVLDTIGRYILQ